MQSGQIIYTAKHSHSSMPRPHQLSPNQRTWRCKQRTMCLSLLLVLCAHTQDTVGCWCETVPPTVLRITKRLQRCRGISFVLPKYVREINFEIKKTKEEKKQTENELKRSCVKCWKKSEFLNPSHTWLALTQRETKSFVQSRNSQLLGQWSTLTPRAERN